MVIAPDFGPWEPLDPFVAADLFASFPARWWIAGGWAIDLFVGRRTRAHDDTDILIRRDDVPLLYAQLPGWLMYAAGRPGGLERWPEGRAIPDDVHDIWCRPAADAPWGLQIMLVEIDGDRWVFRRDRRISGALTDLDDRHGQVPILSPEVQLLYKSRNPRPKDEADLTTALPAMSTRQIVWLLDALRLHDPTNPWIAILDAALRDW